MVQQLDKPQKEKNKDHILNRRKGPIEVATFNDLNNLVRMSLHTKSLLTLLSFLCACSSLYFFQYSIFPYILFFPFPHFDRYLLNLIRDGAVGVKRCSFLRSIIFRYSPVRSQFFQFFVKSCVKKYSLNERRIFSLWRININVQWIKYLVRRFFGAILTILLRLYITVDETRVHLYNPETKQQKQGFYTGEPALKKSKSVNRPGSW